MLVVLGVLSAVALLVLFRSKFENSKIFCAIIFIVICFAIPPLGALLACIGIIYGFCYLFKQGILESKDE